MRRKWKKRCFAALAGLFAGLLMSVGLPELVKDLDAALSVHAVDGNVVHFDMTSAEANDANLVYVDLVAFGTPKSTVTATYRTSSATAIENVDYTGVYNTIGLTLDANGGASYRIAIKCLNDASTRQKLLIYDNKASYGRYFNLDLIEASNATIGDASTCKCYLPYSYKADATTGISDGINIREVAYINDYKNMQAKYHEGDNDISGKETWKTWKEGISFNNETSRRWVDTFINNGLADAYGSYVLRNIDDDKLHSTSNIYMLSGNKEFMDKYSRDSSCPGLSLYYEIEPCKSGGHRIDGKAMYYIFVNKNPHSQQNALVDLEERHVVKDGHQRWWIQESNTWYSNKNSIYDSIFYKTEPYNGILDYGLAIFNNNKSWDREVHDIWLFLALADRTCPSVVNQYAEYNAKSGTIRVALRFNEPVYSSRKKDLTVKLNGYNTNYYAEYVEGNYSDTLVYEIPAGKAPNIKINSVTYELPNDDIGDMAYELDAYKSIRNNLVQNTDMQRTATIPGGTIDLAKPQLAVDSASSVKPNAVYNIMLSANGNGSTSFDDGVVYYQFDKNDYIASPTSPGSYKNSHTLTSEERGSFNLTLAKNEAEGVDSGDYYLHALAVSKYGMTAHDTYGPYRLDGDAPEISQLSPEKNDLQKKIFLLEAKDKSLGTELDTIQFCLRYNDSDGKEQVAKLRLLSGGEIPDTVAKRFSFAHDGEATTYRYVSNIDEEDTESALDSFVLDLMGTLPQLDARVYFEVVDEAGNKATSAAVRAIYDKRTLFEHDIAVDPSYAEDTSIDLGSKVYDITDATSGKGITFTVTEEKTKALIAGGAEYSIVLNGETKYEATGCEVTIADLGPGHYEAIGFISGESGGTAVDLVSKPFEFYLTKGMDDATANKAISQGNLVLTNRVFQLEDVTYYYFRSASSSVATHYYGATYNPANDRYEGGASSPAFSSTVEAKKYVKFMEYQDIELFSLTSTEASLLNGSSGSTIYVKAAKETKNAQEGQLWVRYKRATWTESSTSSGWAFYYYGEGKLSDGLNVNGLSPNLASALDAVTNRIVDAGRETFLVGEDYTNRITGAPYLTAAQMHAAEESATATHNGTSFVSELVYHGDTDLFQNNVDIDGNEYPLATNMPLFVNTSTLLYFKHFGSATWNPILAENGTLLKDALAEQATGLYTLREYGDAGVSEFTVYLDRSLPVLDVTLNKGIAGEENEVSLAGNVTTLTCKNLAMEELVGEVDSQTYVAIYTYPSRVLQTVLYAEQIKDYSLSGGNYFVTVGDRSGNVASYIVRTADSSIQLTMAENESKSGVYIRVENREDIEIYSYEVYLNETLIDNVFEPQKFFRGSGIYRVEVTDIYGNSVVETLTHEAPSPDLTWYYVNDNGGYSIYDPSRPVRMVLQDDPNSPRTTNVFAATTVRVLFNGVAEGSDIEFELLDVPTTDYTYNELSGLLSINSLTSWRLRVWYKNQPENDRTYVFHVDNTAPVVGASCMGNAYEPNVVYDENGDVVTTSTFDNVNFDKYDEGDVVTLDDTSYVTKGRDTISFDTGAVVSSDRVVLHLEDPSGIRSISVTRNGQIVDMEPSEDGDLIFTSYGTFVVTVTDNLGNVSVFMFTNVESNISKGTVDGQTIGTDANAYGHEALEVDTEFDGTTTILVRTPEETVTYEFHYDSGKVTYGQYYVELLERSEEKGDVYSAVYAQRDWSLSIDDDNVRRNQWYGVINSQHYGISVYFDDDGHLRYRVSVKEVEIHVEMSFSVGASHLPDRYIATLSVESPELVLLTGGEVVTKVESLDYIYVSDVLTLDESALQASITRIEFLYSKTPEFDGTYAVLFADGTWYNHLRGEAYGYYRIVVTNKFNNQTVYLINKIESFASVVTITCLDGSRVAFHNNEGTIYSNYAIELTVMSSEVRFVVNGSTTSGIEEGGVTTLTLSRDGKYAVRVEGSNGIFEDFSFEIKSDATFLFKESWIVGYNEEALLRDQGYTNQLCSIVLDDDIVYVDMVIDDERYVLLYDNITEGKKVDPATLVEAIGRYGIGKYTIGFRNKYGDLVTHTVYYNNVPSLLLTRTIASDPVTFQTFDLDLAVRKGFYSNNLLRFSTTSSVYSFTVSGVECRLDEPYSIEFTNSSGNGGFSYRVTFRDEYGNYVEFDAILYRDDVDFDASGMTVIDVNGTLYTKGDVFITFGEDLKATVSVDGGDATDYVSGTVRYADGTYHFAVRDIAGNISTYTVVHKSVNHYSLTNTVTGEDVIDGGVVNNATVSFKADDGSRIKYVVRNGEYLSDYASATFSLTGRYQLLIEDMLGNTSYEEFTVINNSLAVFSYEAPYDYEVTEVWVVKADGSRELTSLSGKSIRLEENGNYVVIVSSLRTTSSFNFTITVDNTAPTASLVGAEEGGVTARDVTLSGLRVGDVIKIYRDGELVSTTTITVSSTSPVINTGGSYRVVVTNLQGVSKEFTFIRKATTNAAGSIFFIVSSILIAVGIGIGLAYHTKLKTDD